MRRDGGNERVERVERVEVFEVEVFEVEVFEVEVFEVCEGDLLLRCEVGVGVYMLIIRWLCGAVKKILKVLDKNVCYFILILYFCAII